VTVEVSDNGNWGTGGVLTASAYVSIDVLPSIADGTVWEAEKVPIHGGIYRLQLTEDTAFSFSEVSPEVLLSSDLDSLAKVHVSLTADHVNFVVNSTASSKTEVSIRGNSLDIDGTASDVNLLLSQVGLIPDANYAGFDELKCNLYEDGSSTDTLVVVLDILPVNDAPFWVASGVEAASLRGVENDGLKLHGIGFHVDDVDLDETFGSMLEVNITARYGSLNLVSDAVAVPSGLSIVSNFEQSLGLLAASLDVLNEALDGGVVLLTPPTGWSGTDELQFVVSDLGSSGEGGPLISTTLDVSVVFDSVEDSVVLSGCRTAKSTTEETLVVGLDITATASNPSSTEALHVNISATHGALTVPMEGSQSSWLSLIDSSSPSSNVIIASGPFKALREMFALLQYMPEGDYNGIDNIA
jgi:hypothetical protein